MIIIIIIIIIIITIIINIIISAKVLTIRAAKFCTVCSLAIFFLDVFAHTDEQ